MSTKSQNTGRNRSSVEIIVEILDACRESGTRRNIMFRSYLDYRQVAKYIAVLSQHQYVRRDEDDRYWLTTKGEQALTQLSTALETLNNIVATSGEAVTSA